MIFFGRKALYIITSLLLLTGCKENKSDQTVSITEDHWQFPYQAISQLGDTLYAPTPSEKINTQLKEKQQAFEQHPDLDNTIWLGRFTAYAGDYRKAIAIYSQGLQKFPDNSRLLRHRGHRYITIREFDNAIADLEKAASLIEGQENMVEQDGLPNAQNIPVSTMHGNIYYHLGLAHYLNRNMPAALEAFKNALNTAPNADNVVSTTHWIYMIQRRMSRTQAAENYLRNIKDSMPVIENQSYYKACLFYKSKVGIEEIYQPKTEDTPSNSAIAYAVGNWFWYNGNPARAKEIYREILSGTDWASFGFIAAETDLAKPFNAN